MRISHQFKFLYIAINKTGSSTVRGLLNPYSDVRSISNSGKFAHHVTAHKLKSVFHNYHWSWDDYFKFSVVRHPVSRLYSLYKYRLRLGRQPPSANFLKNNYGLYKASLEFCDRNISFEEAILTDAIPTPSQCSFVVDPDNGDMLLDQVIKLEDLANGLNGVWNRLGLRLEDLRVIPVLNASNQERSSWHGLLGPAAMAKVESIYEADYALFDY